MTVNYWTGEPDPIVCPGCGVDRDRDASCLACSEQAAYDHAEHFGRKP